MSSRLSLCIIAKDEQENLAQCLSSVAPHVDEVIVCDTGSTDATKKVAASHGALVYDCNPQTHPQYFFVDDAATCSTFSAPPPYSGDVALGDFGGARNESFKHATGDFVLWVDADDVVVGAEKLRAVVADMVAKAVDLAFFKYEYARDEAGNLMYSQWRERLARRGATAWMNPVHEVMLPTRPVSTAKYGDVVISHRRKADRKSIPNRNYKILLRQMQQTLGRPAAAPFPDSTDPRTLFYLGQEARFIEPERAIVFYSEYLKRSGWPEERAAAHSSLGQLYEFGIGVNDLASACQLAFREHSAAAVEMPENPDGIFGAARVAYAQGRWLDCVRYSERGFVLGQHDSMLGANPLDRTYRPHVYYSHALAHLGRLEEAIASCKAGLAAAPSSPGIPGFAPGVLANALVDLERKLAMKQKGTELQFSQHEDVEAPPHPNIPPGVFVVWGMQIWKQAIAANDERKARAALEAIPGSAQADPAVARMWEVTERKFSRSETKAPTFAADATPAPVFAAPPHSLSIAIWTGPAFEPWDPYTPNVKGIGGSETAAIEMARELAKRGHRVTVYAECDGEFDGVKYVHYQKCPGIDCDVLIVSRQPALMEHVAGIRAKLKLLWVHDIHCGPPAPQMERWLYQFDRVLCLSNWHREYFLSVYPTLDPGRVLVTRNGIDPARFTEGLMPVANDLWKSNRLIFSSSPNRGLDNLLHLFPAIRARVPDAELHIYYGFDCWETLARQANNQEELAVVDEYKRRINSAVKEGGVHFHGRVNQKTLAEAWMRSKVWAYPTAFTETSCLHPDTLISVPGDHRGGPPRVRIADLVGKSGFPVYAYDAEQYRFRLATCNKVWETKIANEMVGVELDDGNVLKLTPDHLVMNFDGEWVQAGDLVPGTRLMALHHRYNVMIKDVDGSWADEHRLVGEWMEGRPLLKSEHVDHADPMRLDNRPESLQVMTASEHFSKTHKGSKRSKRADAGRVVGWREWANENKEELRARLASNGKKLWDWVRSLPPDERRAWNEERARKRVAAQKERAANDPVYAAHLLENARANGQKGAHQRWGKNHEVVSVKRIPGGPVYDMEVAELHNFVAEGVVVHNCISAMEAQAAGCVPVCPPLAALAETVKHGVFVTDGDRFVDEVYRLLADEGYRRSFAEPGRKYALENLTWSGLAADWEAMFRRVMEEDRVRPIPVYREVAA